jgi:F0F1-type ATP synthase epsilon subunit
MGQGTLTYSEGGAKHVLNIDGGFVEVFDNHVRVLADRAEAAS